MTTTFTWRNVSKFSEAPERVHDGHPVTMTAPLAPLDQDDPDARGATVRCMDPSCVAVEFTAFEDELIPCALCLIVRSIVGNTGLCSLHDPLPPGQAPTWPTTADERAAFADWQHEVACGDTLRGFRDWLNHHKELDDPETLTR